MPDTRQLYATRMGKLVRWIYQHLGDDLQLNVLAKRALLSKNDLHPTVHGYIRHRSSFIRQKFTVKRGEATTHLWNDLQGSAKTPRLRRPGVL